MTFSRNLERNLRPFANATNEFLLLPPNRFALQICSRRGIYEERKRIGWKYTPTGHWVLGTLNQPVADLRKFSMPDALMQCRALSRGWSANDLESLPLGKVVDFSACRSSDAVLHFTLNRDAIALLQRVARGFAVKVKKRRIPPNITLLADGGGIRLHISSIDETSKIAVAMTGEITTPIKRNLDTTMVKYLCVDDYAVTVDAKGIVEMIGIETGLVFLIHTRS